ncbi:Pr6Pr family membrane protein [Paragemmobacter ruber]|uniref:Pr6Pr family membrane protein n=1 Tax=Paragemmobacter ruber TaxID=1985673 RepID=A0ABW9Y0S8_9RHOB|nr:Pr6Pr family membrane protein [Rhodobacter ruber]NBE06084.1 hypothetical protein [Rhodobacter ruber]
MTPGPTIPPAARRAAAALALLAWAALVVQLAAVMQDGTASLPVAVWALLRYFTILTNLALALAMTGIALGWALTFRPAILGGVTLSLLLVGSVYHLLLRGIVPLAGLGLIADLLLHSATPLAALIYWCAFVPRGHLRPRHALLWTLYPIAYGAYALTRGLIDGIYPYPFLDLPRIGLAHTALNGAAVILAFAGAALVVAWLDRRHAPLSTAGQST